MRSVASHNILRFAEKTELNWVSEVMIFFSQSFVDQEKGVFGKKT